MKMPKTAPASISSLFWIVLLLVSQAHLYGQEPSRTGEVRFTSDTQDERDAGVWIDGRYAGYVKELKGDRKVMLPAGEHELSIRQAGYKELTKKIIVEPDQVQTIPVPGLLALLPM